MNTRWDDVRRLLADAVPGGNVDPYAMEKLYTSWRDSWKVQTFRKHFGDLRIIRKVPETVITDEETEGSVIANSAIIDVLPDVADALRNAWTTHRMRAAAVDALAEAYTFTRDVQPVDLVRGLSVLDGRVFDFVSNRTLVDLTDVLGANAPKGAKASKILRKLMLSRLLHKVYPSYCVDWLRSINDTKSLEFVVDGILTLMSLVTQALTAKNSDEIQVVLSVDPVDILTASTHTTGWSSCFDIYDGCYKAAPLSILGDDTTCVGYVFAKTNTSGVVEVPVKMFRQWVTFVPEQHSAIFGRRYPGERAVLEKVLRGIAAEVLAKTAGLDGPVRWVKRSDGNYGYRTSDWVYYDKPRTAITLQQYTDEVNYIEQVIGTDTVPCLCCGVDRYDDNNHDTLVCDDCSGGATCVICGGHIDEDDIQWYDNDPYCCDCFDARFEYCSRCGEPYDRDCLTYTHDDRCLCEHCLDREGYSPCDECGEFYITDEMTSTQDDRLLCDDCLADNYTECKLCGEYVPNDDVTYTVDYSAVCDDCLADNYTECKLCGEYVPNDDVVTIAGESYCQECAAHMRSKAANE